MIGQLFMLIATGGKSFPAIEVDDNLNEYNCPPSNNLSFLMRWYNIVPKQINVLNSYLAILFTELVHVSCLLVIGVKKMV